MDTGSHLLFGATLAGLSFLDPGVAGNPDLAHATLAAAMIGSHAPDFDTVTRLKSYRHYIRYHRGITHSLPAILIWPAAISLPVAFAFGVADSWPVLYLWSLLAVALHVFLDWLNAYGVQCFRPFDRRWRHLDVLPLFDPFLFALHAAGLFLWLAAGLEPVPLFATVYGATFLYIGARRLHLRTMVRQVRAYYGPEARNCQIVPGLSWFRGQFILETDGSFYTGKVRGNGVLPGNCYEKEQAHPAAQATLEAACVKTFLHFAERVHVSIMEEQDGYEVKWRDVRFWHDSKLPFGVDVKLDRNMQVLRQRLHWSKKAWDPPYV